MLANEELWQGQRIRGQMPPLPVELRYRRPPVARMSDWIDVAPESGLPPGDFTLVDVDDVMIAVFNIGGAFFAIEDVCTHDGGDLVSGCVRGDTVECPRHGAVFSIRTGEALAPPAYEPVATFPVRVSDGTVQVRDDRWD